MRLYRASRRALFAQLDQPALRAAPRRAVRLIGEWRINARVNIDYHIELRGHYYSVPYALMHEQVDRPLTATIVEIFHRGQRVAVHVRNPVRGRHTTDPPTCPWPISATWSGRPRGSSRGAGPSARRPPPSSRRSSRIVRIPSRAHRSCLGLLRLGKRYGEDRLEAACARAVAVGARSYRHVDAMLKHGLDRLAVPEASPPLTLTPVHAHLRGPAYYQ